ncbi:MAG TPA: 2-isopropylmalate synthase [Terriglobales bacterium]|jgi:2-isopropylmalate synthase|nr:2-isopropylmalate synthase [Terriglobales bacterium]
MERERIVIFDTTLRDGEQSPGCSMNLEEKLVIARQLEALGVDVIEAGFPISSQGDFAGVQKVAAEVRRPVITALARAKKDDIQCAWDAVKIASKPRIHLFLASSDIHLQHKLKITREQALQQTKEAVAFAKSLLSDIEFSPEDATRTDPQFLCAMVETAIAAGATTVNIPDTVGYTMPEEFARIITTILREVKGADKITLSVHCHNDLGMAVANSLAAVKAGARQVETCMNGIGERAGNCAMEEVVMAMRVRPDLYPFETGVVSEQIYPTSQLIAKVIGVAPQPNKAIVGNNAFAHEAGIHQHGMLNNPLCYEIMTPQSVGAPGSRMVLGKHSGRHALASRYAELGYKLSDEDLEICYQQFIALADRKKNVYEQDLISFLPAPKRPAPAHAQVAQT